MAVAKDDRSEKTVRLVREAVSAQIDAQAHVAAIEEILAGEGAPECKRARHENSITEWLRDAAIDFKDGKDVTLDAVRILLDELDEL